MDATPDTPIAFIERRKKLRSMVRGAYDLQKLRTQMGLRLVANFKSRMGFKPGEKEGEIEVAPEHSFLAGLEDEDNNEEVSTPEAEKAKKEKKLAELIIEQLRKEYLLITEGVAKNRELPTINKFRGTELIHDYAELAIVNSFFSTWNSEKTMFKSLVQELEKWPVWTEFLQWVPGIGPAMGGVILSEFDIHTAKYPTSMFVYAGLDVALDGEGAGKGRSKRKEHLVLRKYVNKAGKEDERLSVTYNPFLKTKLMGVLAASFLRARSPYAEIYRNYRTRLQNRHDVKTNPKEFTKLRVHRMALRYMVKMFIIDLHYEWCIAEGKDPTVPYHEEYLQNKHSGGYVRDKIKRG